MAHTVRRDPEAPMRPMYTARRVLIMTEAPAWRALLHTRVSKRVGGSAPGGRPAYYT